MHHLKQFAQRLETWGQESQYPQLLEYARELATQIENFDMEQLP